MNSRINEDFIAPFWSRVGKVDNQDEFLSIVKFRKVLNITVSFLLSISLFYAIFQ